MTDLEQTYYILGIVFMSIMLVLITVAVVYIIVIRNRIARLEKTVSDKLHTITHLPETIVDIAAALNDRAKK